MIVCIQYIGFSFRTFFQGHILRMKTPIFGERANIPYFSLAFMSSDLKLHNYRVRERMGKLKISAHQLQKCAVADIERFLSDQDRLPVELTIDKMQF